MACDGCRDLPGALRGHDGVLIGCSVSFSDSYLDVKGGQRLERVLKVSPIIIFISYRFGIIKEENTQLLGFTPVRDRGKVTI